MFKSGYVGIVGKPNAGKSTLVNKLVGFKVAITTPKPQTTRFNIRGIRTSKTSQIVFIDTPGVHTPSHKLGKYMMKGVTIVVADSDVIVYLVDASKPFLDDANKKIIQELAEAKKKIILAINKVDAVKKENILKIMDEYIKYLAGFGGEFKAIVPISVVRDDGLDILVRCIEDELLEGEKIFDDDEVTDISERDIAEEIIREKLLSNLDEEIPHGINVVIEKMKKRTTENGNDVYDIDAEIICKKDNHKPIILGKEGLLIKKITNLARRDIEEMTDTRVNLKIWVKVRSDWENQDNFLGNIKDKIR